MPTAPSQPSILTSNSTPTPTITIPNSAINPTLPIHLTTTHPLLAPRIKPFPLAALTHLHAHCITHDGTLATFLPPLTTSKLSAFWARNIEQVASGERDIIIKLERSTGGQRQDVDGARVVKDPEIDGVSRPAPRIKLSSSGEGDGEEEWEVAAVVTLFKPVSETGPFRGIVEKFFVSPGFRRRGLGRVVMQELERVAWENGRWSLMLDTTVGTGAESVYPKLGWTRLGVVEDYGVHPLTGDLVNEVWFWKDLRKQGRSANHT